ncbi:MAG: hypothetical protein LC798_08345 [Chloroflexi bacterium]|nr:hypothetical protein [Chloroflexota bacterium]
MKLESRIDEFMASVDRDFGLALEDAADHAANLPGSPSDLHAERLGPFHGRIGSTKPYAKAQEKGAYITPRKGRVGRNGRPAALKAANGRFYKWVRLPAQRYLAKTGRQWGSILVARLRAG